MFSRLFILFAALILSLSFVLSTPVPIDANLPGQHQIRDTDQAMVPTETYHILKEAHDVLEAMLSATQAKTKPKLGNRARRSEGAESELYTREITGINVSDAPEQTEQQSAQGGFWSSIARLFAKLFSKKAAKSLGKSVSTNMATSAMMEGAMKAMEAKQE